MVVLLFRDITYASVAIVVILGLICNKWSNRPNTLSAYEEVFEAFLTFNEISYVKLVHVPPGKCSLNNSLLNIVARRTSRTSV